MSRFRIIRPLLVVLILACLPMSAAAAANMDLLFVVDKPASLTSAESERKAQFEAWGYAVTLIDHKDSSGTFSAAAAAHSVAYVSPTASSLGTKLKSASIGVVNEHLDLADRFGFCTSSNTTLSTSEIRAVNSTHYISYGLATGSNTTILTSNQTLVRRTGTLASGAMTLADVRVDSSTQHPGLIVLEVGAALSGGGTAAGRRVLLPFGSPTFDYAALNSTGLSIVRKSLEWAARPNPSIGNVLLVVTSTSSPTAQETLRQMQIDVWGYDVTPIAADATQSSFDTALAGKDAVYISREVSPTSVGTKLTGATIGIVNEQAELSDELGISSSRTYPSGSSITISGSHPITASFGTGSLTIVSSSSPLTAVSGTLAPGLEILATVGGSNSLAVLEAGAAITPSGNAAGRRVQLPFGGGGFDFDLLTEAGKTLLLNALEWAAASTAVSGNIYYVRTDGNDANTGTGSGVGQAWKTLAKATTSTAVGAGDTIYVRIGTYTAGKIAPNRDGTATNPIRYIADTDGTIFGTSPGEVVLSSTGTRVFEFDGDNYFEFTGFKLTNASNETVNVKSSVGVVFDKCIFSGGQKGFRVENSGASATVRNCLIHGASVAGILVSNGTLTAWNSTVVSNADGIQQGNGTATIRNFIVANNTGTGLRRNGGTMNHSYCLVWGNTAGNYSGTSAGTGNISADPQFVNNSNDFHLRNTSPAIDAGTTASGTVDDDLDGLARPIGATWDMGCYEAYPAGNLLMVVSSTLSPNSQETARRALVSTFGYKVNLIDDDDSQSDYNTAIAANIVAYVSNEIVPGSLGTKLRDAAIGVVSEHGELTDVFGISSSRSYGIDSAVTIAKNGHYITAPFALGPLDVFSSPQMNVSLAETVSKHALLLGTWGTAGAITTLEAGAKRHDTGTVYGRRVQLPWGASGFNINELNAGGQLILQRSLEWAAALVGHWKLDETSGTLAADSSQNALHGTLVNGPGWTTGKIAGGLEFDGFNDYVDLGNSDLLNITGDLTLSAWVKFHSIGTGNDAGAIISWANGSYSTYPFHLVVIDDGTGKLVLRFNHGLGPKDTAGQILPGTWHHVAASIHGTNLHLYIDGQADAANPHSLGTRSAGNGYCTLGRAASQRPHAVMDDVRVYKYAMGADEVQALKASARKKGVRILQWVEVR